jgi:hypothetical protein
LEGRKNESEILEKLVCKAFNINCKLRVVGRKQWY